MQLERTAITGILLCGGEGRRMGGRDKPLELLHGQPLVAHVHARLAPQVGPLLLSCNRNLERYAAWGDARIIDEVPGLGPLGGLVSALAQVRTPWAFACPGDTPRLAATLVAHLAAGCRGPADICYAHDGARAQPLFLLLPTRAAASIRAYLERGQRSVLGWLDTAGATAIDCAGLAASFANANTLDELRALAAIPDSRPAPDGSPAPDGGAAQDD